MCEHLDRAHLFRQAVTGVPLTKLLYSRLSPERAVLAGYFIASSLLQSFAAFRHGAPGIRGVTAKVWSAGSGKPRVVVADRDGHEADAQFAEIVGEY